MTTLVDAWQAALAAEQRAAFGYTVLGPRLPSAMQKIARSCQAEHETVRDRTAQAIAAQDATPAAPAGDYPDLYPLAKNPRQLAALLEDECAAAWRYLYAVASGVAHTRQLRRHAQDQLTAGALRGTRWRRPSGARGALQAFPGLT